MTALTLGAQVLNRRTGELCRIVDTRPDAFGCIAVQYDDEGIYRIAPAYLDLPALSDSPADDEGLTVVNSDPLRDAA